MPDRKKRIIRIISIGLITALFAGMVLSSQTKVVQAKDVFLDVQIIRNSNLKGSAETFTILEIVDKVGTYTLQKDANGNITGGNLALGEEEIGYLVGGQEPFYKLYKELYQSSRRYSSVSLDTPLSEAQKEQLSQIATIYAQLVTIINGMVGSDKLITVAEDNTDGIISYKPNPQEYYNYIRFVNEDVTKGYLVPDAEGAYAAQYNADNEIERFIYAGDASTPVYILDMDLLEEPDEEEENEELEEPEETEEDLEDQDSENQDPEEQDPENQDPENQDPENQDPENQDPENQDPENQDPENQDPEEQDPENQDPENQDPEDQNPENQDPEDQNPEPPNPENPENPNPENPDPNNQSPTPQAPAPETPTAQTPTPEPSTPQTQESVTVEDAGEVVEPQTSIKYEVEVVEGKQVVLMSQVVDSVQRYSFYPEGTYATPEEAEAVGAKLVATATAIDTVPTATLVDHIYQFKFVGLNNNEWFKNHVFGLEVEPQSDEISTENMNVEVVTCTPNDAELATKIANADLVYWNADLKYTDNNGTQPGNDISVSDALELLERITEVNDLPCIVNNSVYTSLNPEGGDANTSNINKIMLLLYQEDVKDIYEDTRYQFNIATTWGTDIAQTPWKNIGDLIINATTPADSTYWNNGHFVRDNIYVVDHPIHDITKGLNVEITSTSEEEKAKAFDAVVYRIEQEEYQRQQAGGLTWNDDTLTPALAIQTILTYAAEPPVIQKSHIKVLELQPCYSFDYAGKVGEFKKMFLPGGEASTVEVEIVGMTTSEFCGKLQDINVEYDMIYLGSNTNLMNRINVAPDGAIPDYCTVYNDFNMYGILYSHIGDLCHIKDHGGLLSKNEDDTYRYSGNDILAEQEQELLSFLASKAPVVVEDDFFFRNADEKITSISTGPVMIDGNPVLISDPNKQVTGNVIIRNGILDSSTYIYQFVKKACTNTGISYGSTGWSWENREYKNFLTISDVEKDKDRKEFTRWLNQPKMSIHMLSQPTEYGYTTRQVGDVNVIADSSYLQREDNGYFLSYEFYISNLASVSMQNTTYSVALFIDTNMDGKYSAVSENLSDGSFVVINTETGQTENRNNLKAGVHYLVRRQLPYDAVGAVPWKLVVSHNGNSNIRSDVTGITAVRTQEKQEIKILQLYDTKNENANIQKHMENPNSKWRILLENVPDFEVNIKSVDAELYFKGDLEEDLDNYDMLIVGFADTYQISTSYKIERLQAIVEYANSGKCVLFSHDNTNWQNAGGQNSKLNMYIRDLTGLDRYGVTIFRTTDGNAYNNNNKIKDGVDRAVSTTPGSTKEIRAAFFASMGMGAYTRDIAFSINSDQMKMDSRTQGITYSANEHDRYVYSDASKTSSFMKIPGIEGTYRDYYRYLDLEGIAKETWINSYDTYQVQKVNQGAITEYPYRLSDTIGINTTHAQYYQLDLESDKDNDGEGDIVVWYTINNSAPGAMNDVYDHSPNDVRNNYYIYNRGNITYTGMGHSNIDKEEEIKLFINTMVAAYRVSIQSPEVMIIESQTDDTNKNFDAIPVELMVANKENNYQMYFKIEDMNLVSEGIKQIRTKIYMGGGSDNINIGGEKIEVTDKTLDADWQVFDTAGNSITKESSGYYVLKPGVVYYLSVPLKEDDGAVTNISEYKSIDVYVEAQTVINKNGKVIESAVSFDNFKLTQINLFDLD